MSADLHPRLSSEIEDHQEAMQESLAWAFASHRLERPESQIFPEELRSKDWTRARVAIDAVKEFFDAAT